MPSDPIGFARESTEKSRAVQFALLEWVAVGVLLATLVVMLQLIDGAYQGEFPDDEASHYISGLFLKEWLTSDFLTAPLRYLQEFHSRYPLVGIGHWPPFFYGVEALWMLILGQSKISVIALSAVVTFVTSMTIYKVLANRLGWIEGLFAAIIFLMSPMVRSGSTQLMLDIPVALFCFFAMLSYVRYLDTGRAWYSVLFGVLASAALLVKGNAVSLALLPALAVVLGGRWDLLRKPSFWAPVPIVAVMTGPWYVFTYGMVEQGFRYAWGWTYVATATAENSRYLLENLGVLTIVFAAIGFVRLVFRAGKPADNLLVAASALFLSVWIFQTLIPAAIQDRYLIPALPCLIIMAVYGVHAVFAKMKSAISPQMAPAVLAGVFAVMLFVPMAARSVAAPPKQIMGFAVAAKEVWALRHERNPVVLIVADGAGEAAAIAELAMLDPHPPSLFAVRGSRIFGGGGYNRQDYLPRFEHADSLMREIEEYAIPLMILQRDPTGKDWTHIRQVEELIARYPERWRILSRNTSVSPEVLVVQILGNLDKDTPTERLVTLTGPKALKPLLRSE